MRKTLQPVLLTFMLVVFFINASHAWDRSVQGK